MNKFIFFLSCIFFFSCVDSNNKNFHTRIVNEWNGKDIIFPDSNVFFVFGETIDNHQIPKSEYKILVYVDSIGCISCKLNLEKWKELIVQVDSITNKSVPFLFFFHPNNIRDLKLHIKMTNFNYPVCIDKNDRLNKINQFSSNIIYQTFLLNKENKVILLGNPILNPRIKQLYINEISGIKNEDINETSLSIKNSTIDLGSFDWTETIDTVVVVKNTGNVDLAVMDVISSCGCTVVEYDNRITPPGKEMIIKIIFKAERPEYFERNIIIHSNAIKSPSVVWLKGEATEFNK